MSEIKPQYRSKSPEQALEHVLEECGEFVAAMGKLHRWGPHSFNPELSQEERETNIDWALRELTDIDRAIKQFRALMLSNGAPYQ